MTLRGTRPANPDARTYGHTTLPVHQTRTQALKPGDAVLRSQRKYTVLEVTRKPDGWLVVLRNAKGVTRPVTKPAGFVWSVLPPPEEKN